ncbi:MAG: biotin/lipoate protein ligase [Gemmatimonadetes bacterium]|nr:biotin/lipoate protein ligase [Gemmatimonadota bacterium]
MALDHALMERARRMGESVLRVYEWASPVLSLGRNQRARDVYDDAELARRGVTVVRRPTGGRALLHHREITYSVTAPTAATQSLAATYGRINEVLLDALGSLGVPATLATPSARSRLPNTTPCFAEPAKGEIVVGGRKLAGSAQWRYGGALLQHGSIIVDDDQVTIPSLMREPAEPSPPPATLREILGRPVQAAEIAEALFQSVRRMEDRAASMLSRAEMDSLDINSQLTLYRDSAWTWRR